MYSLFIFKAKHFGDSSLQCRTHALGCMIRGAKPLTCQGKVLHFWDPYNCGLSCVGWGFWLEHFSASALLFFVVEALDILFLGHFQRILFHMYLYISVDLLCLREGVSSGSSILNRFLYKLKVQFCVIHIRCKINVITIMMMVRKKTALVMCYIVTRGERKDEKGKKKGEFSRNAFLEDSVLHLALILYL